MTDSREELWETACALNPRHQSQLRLLAVQARRRDKEAKTSEVSRLRRWWEFGVDYAHPVEAHGVAVLGGIE